MKQSIKKNSSGYDFTKYFESQISEQDVDDPIISTVPSIQDYIRTHITVIPRDILDAYLKKNSFYKKDTSIFDDVPDDNNPYKYYEPYQFQVYGSYPLLSDWLRLYHKMKLCYFPNTKFDFNGINYALYTKPRVLELLKVFAAGFQQGFDDFIQNKITATSLFHKKEELNRKRLSDFLVQSEIGSSGFNITSDKNQDNNDWYVDGVNTGYNYHAWYLIFNNGVFSTHPKKRGVESGEPDKLIKNKSSNTQRQVATKKGLTENDERKKNNDVIIHHETPRVRPTWEQYIKPDAQDYIENIESNFEDKIEKWAQGHLRIECAAFSQLLFDEHYFVKGSTCRGTVEKFALSKYHCVITTQLNSTHRSARDIHKSFFKKYFKKGHPVRTVP
jgi:hypothetical protein